MGVGAGLYMYDVVVKTFTFAISSTDEFLSLLSNSCPMWDNVGLTLGHNVTSVQTVSD